MEAPTQNAFAGWAKVEVLGHQTHIGYTVTEAYGGVVMFRVDQPELEEEDLTLTRREYTEAGYWPAGSIVKRGKIEAASVLVGAGSIYRITPCTEEAARLAIRESVRRPLVLVRLPDMAVAQISDSSEGGAYTDLGDEHEDDERGF